MSTVEQIEQAVLQLSPEERAKFDAWYAKQRAASLKTVEAIQRGMDEHKRGESVSMREALEKLGAEHGMKLGE